MQRYGLAPTEDDPRRADFAAGDSVEIPRWRHALINLPHPLLKLGLTLLDTPGLNSLGSEPEMTLDVLPNADVLFTHADAVHNTKVLFAAAKQAGVERIVHVSITKFTFSRGAPAVMAYDLAHTPSSDIAGISAALELANAGYHVYLVEREPSIGGHMARLDKTFPTLDCSACILTPRMVEVGQHPNITLWSYCEVEKVSGYIGNFTVNVRKRSPLCE